MERTFMYTVAVKITNGIDDLDFNEVEEDERMRLAIGSALVRYHKGTGLTGKIRGIGVVAFGVDSQQEFEPKPSRPEVM